MVKKPVVRVICEEFYGCRDIVRKYHLSGTGFNVTDHGDTKHNGIRKVITVFKEMFLPQGYPDSVSEDYMTYQMWDTVQAFCSSITGTLSCHAVLKGVGVGDETATVAAATFTWLMKEGTGMIGRIVFAWCRGTQLDQKCKTWRFRADVLNDFALSLDLISPSFPSAFRILTCVSSISKSIVGVAGGATRAALTVHQARRDNMADVAAKDGSQETLVNLLGLLAGLIFTPLLDGNPWLIWALFFIFTIMHVFANHRAVTCVAMETINEARLRILIENYQSNREGTSMSRAVVNHSEPVLTNSSPLTYPFHLGVPLTTIIKSSIDFSTAIQRSASRSYMIGIDTKKRCIGVVLHKDISSLDMIRAAFQCIILNDIFNRVSNSNKALADSREQTLKQFPDFMRLAMDHGWTFSRNLLGPTEWRADWKIKAETKKEK